MPDGKKVKAMEHCGYVRLKALFEFFPTYVGKNPKGLGGTVLVNHHELHQIRKVDIVALGTKYAELGGVIRSLAMAGGATDA